MLPLFSTSWSGTASPSFHRLLHAFSLLLLSWGRVRITICRVDSWFWSHCALGLTSVHLHTSSPVSRRNSLRLQPSFFLLCSWHHSTCQLSLSLSACQHALLLTLVGSCVLETSFQLGPLSLWACFQAECGHNRAIFCFRCTFSWHSHQGGYLYSVCCFRWLCPSLC